MAGFFLFSPLASDGVKHRMESRMSDDVQAVATDASADTSAETITTDTKTVPYDRFKAVNTELQSLKQWRKEQESAAEQRAREAQEAEAARLAEDGKHKELSEKLQKQLQETEPYKVKAEKYEGVLGKLLESERKAVPDYVTPLLDKLDPADQLEYIAANKEKWSKPTPPDINAGNGGGKRGDVVDKSDDELKQQAVILGVDPARYVENYKRLNARTK